MSGLLTAMAQSSLTRLEAARAQEPEKNLWMRASDLPPPPQLKLCAEGFDIIAECKLASPSMGDLSAHTTGVADRVQSYASGGACAVSILTEPTRFGGNLDHLAQAAAALAPLDVPVMRKDFLVDPYQVMEARAAGAGGVLVIVRMLEKSHITALLDCAAMLKMFVLLEAFDAADLTVMQEVLEPRKAHNEQVLAGLNCRDLDTLAIEVARFEELAHLLPPGHAAVAESGVTSVQDVKMIVQEGYRLALIGTTLMASPEPRELLTELLTQGREHAMALQTRRIKLAAGDSVDE